MAAHCAHLVATLARDLPCSTMTATSSTSPAACPGLHGTTPHNHSLVGQHWARGQGITQGSTGQSQGKPLYADLQRAVCSV